MTREEKAKKIAEYCDSLGEYGCPNCPLYDYPENECSDGDADIDRNYEVLFGDSEDVVNRPKHYTDGKIEVIEFIEDKKLGFCLGNAVKYIARAGKKDPTKEVEDLKKAEWYIKRRIKELEEASGK